MKRAILTLIIFLSLTLGLRAQWVEIIPGPKTFIDEISVVNDDVLWLKDQQDSIISITPDGGKTWNVRNLPPEIRDNAPGGLAAVSATTAYTIAGMGSGIGIYKTTNSGLTWTKQISGFNDSTSFIDLIYFWNANEGVVIGDATNSRYFEIYTTSDGGINWNRVPSSSMPDGKSGYTLNSSRYYKAKGNNFYFSTNDGRIFKSIDKGLNWTEIKTPLTTFVDFDFKDDNNGIISTGTNASTYKQYVTTDGGITWLPLTVPGYVGTLKYLASENVYFTTAIWKGLLYSSDNGQNWTEHPSMKNAGLSQTVVTPNGTILIGGWGKIYKTSNYKGLNPAISKLTYKNSRALDVEFNKEVEITSAQDITHFNASFVLNNYSCRVNLASATKDNTDGKIVHLITESDMPADTIYVNINNVRDLSEFPVIEKSFGASSSFISPEVISNTKNIRVPVAGLLKSLFTTNEKNSIYNLTLTGKIDARDVKFMRDSMPLLSTLDLSNVNIMQYSGSDGTSSDTLYLANQMPACSFVNTSDWVGKATLTSVKLPVNITSVGWSAFESCVNITGLINIPAGVTEIQDWAFFNCSSLNGFDVDASNLNFSQKEGVLFNKNQTVLYQYPAGKQGSYVIPSTVSSIEYYSFYACKGLTGVTIPASVDSIAPYAFSMCSGMKEFIVDAANHFYSAINGILFNKKQNVLMLYPAGLAGAYTIPDHVTTIGRGAFSYCTLLTGNLIIPDNVTSIEDNAFQNCEGLTGLSLGQSLKNIGQSAFYYCNNITGNLIIPQSVDTIGSQAFYYCSSLNSLQLSNSVREIGPWTFGGCSGLTGHLIIPNAVVSIGYDAFARCTGLTEITIGNGVQSIGYAAFTRCSAAKKITLGSAVSFIDQYAFNLNTMLTKIISKNPVPPAINANSFNSVDKTLCQLVVPTGTVQTYKTASYWNEFNQTSGLGGPAITVSFKKPTDWTASTVNIWAWYNGVNLFAAWPGAPMTEIGNGWYSYTFAESVTAVNIVLSNAGTPQSVDINNITQSVCYEKDAESNGMITVKLTDCGVTGIHENEYDTAMKLYPQPAREYFKIELPASCGNESFAISIMDLSGKVLRNETFSGNEKTVERENLTPGFYILQITGENTRINYKTKLIFE